MMSSSQSREWYEKLITLQISHHVQNKIATLPINSSRQVVATEFYHEHFHGKREGFLNKSNILRRVSTYNTKDFCSTPPCLLRLLYFFRMLVGESN